MLFRSVNVNPAYRSHELSFVLGKSGIRVLFLRESDARMNYRAVLEESRASCSSALEQTVYFDTPQWNGFLREPDAAPVPLDAADPVNIQYTSGTTGQPKGVVLTHINILNNARFIAEYMNL